MEKFDQLKSDINTIKNKIVECNDKQLSKFDIEMTLMTELPELYNSYPWLIKSFSRSQPSEFMIMMNKMVGSLETVVKGEATLASVEMKLGQELFDHYVGDKIKPNPDAVKDK